ncbi:MAG TPA: MFS transporter, partial [Solirubrobacteraceae bacterium]|nr:MFS transporter [Solirubrobacteraceae bacterium]
MTEATVQTGTIETNLPARLDRLPWSRFHWLVVVGLGTVWILDGLEVTIVGSIGGRLTESGSGINLGASQIGLAGAIYVIGACLGALFFGQLTDRFGRKKLFMITLAVYIAATAATAFSFAAWYFFVVRFFTGAGIGGEYAAINSAIDELIPARARGRVDLTINGSYWIGSVIASALAILFLDKSIFPADLGWRLEFGVGVVLAFGILIVRRHVPESPRWLFIHGQEEEAEAIVARIESDVEEETGQELETPDKTITVRQRTSIPFREIAQVAFKTYPKRAILGLALFIGQAFIYNGITFNLGTLFTTFYGVSSSFVPVFVIIYGIGNFLGPLLLGRLFDTVGRKPMITSMYLGSALLTVPMAILFTGGTLGQWEFEAFVFVVFFLASAGASAAYLTVSEIFPMETRALAIAFFYAVGTGVGGAIGPLLFGNLINSGLRSQVEIAFFIGAAVMAIGGIAEILFGVRAEQAQLEDIAAPLTADEAEQEGEPEQGEEETEQDGVSDELLAPERRQSLGWRRQAEEARAWAAEHRARAHEVRFESDGGNGQSQDRVGIEEALSEIADLQGRALDERAYAEEARARAADSDEPHERDCALELAEAAEQRATAQDEHAAALGAEDSAEAERHEALAAAATERARAHQHR